MKIWKKSVLFYLGGCVYMAMELCWRGRSHGSMFLAGGTCFLLVGQLNRVQPRLPLFWRMLAGAGIITMVELAAGLLVNRNFLVWDYRSQWGNFCGQICPAFTLLWIPIAGFAMAAFEWLEPRINRTFSPRSADPQQFPHRGLQ